MARPLRRPAKLRRPLLTEDQILAWADAHRRLTGKWPTVRGTPHGPRAAPAERWLAIDNALRAGLRGLRGGSSLARLLSKRRGTRNPMDLPDLTVRQVLRWCDDFHRHTGAWPRVGLPNPEQPIRGSDGETWRGVHAALSNGTRGLPSGSSLAKFLAEHRAVRNVGNLPALSIAQVLKWADTHYAQTGSWPTEGADLQEIPGSGGETWFGVITAMRSGHRGFPRGSSLATLLVERRGVRNIQHLPTLSIPQILAWADAFHAGTGAWPTGGCSPQDIPDTNGEQWGNVNQALQKGLRGLPGGSSLAQLLAEHRDVRNSNLLPPLSLTHILRWADAFRDATGEWPTVHCSPQLIDGTAGERWRNVDNALRYGLRGMSGGSSLARLLARRRGVPNVRAPMAARMKCGHR